MRQPSHPGSRAYDASERKTFHNALCLLLHTDFPGVFGGDIAGIFADRINQLYERSILRAAASRWAKSSGQGSRPTPGPPGKSASRTQSSSRSCSTWSPRRTSRSTSRAGTGKSGVPESCVSFVRPTSRAPCSVRQTYRC